MNNSIVNLPVSFWEFIQNNSIQIPIIQRDYAQGREDKVDLRSNFLNEIKEHLKSKDGLLLDFVYGTSKNGIQPLDGQQRLTTLWLLHWYFAFRKGEKKYAPVLRKFSYQTRISSREFIDNLCSLIVDTPQQPQDGVAKFIQNQTWFSYGWKQDPTIQAMLVMLSGTDSQKRDGIETVFGANQDIDSLELLYRPDCPIKFYYLSLEGIKQSDDLYIKMNHRGEQLTDFENFKADWVGYMRKKTNPKLNKFVTINDAYYILAKLDTTWSDLFWNPQEIEIKFETDNMNNAEQKDYIVDELFFTFIKLFFANTLFSDYKKNIGDIKEIQKQLNSRYTSLKVYECVINEEIVGDLRQILDALPKNINQLLRDAVPLIKTNDFVFLPEYRKNKDKENEIKCIKTFQETVLFYAISKFVTCSGESLFIGKSLNDNFKHWLRLSSNFAYSKEIDSEKDLPGRIKMINSVVDFFSNPKDLRWADVYSGLDSISTKDAILLHEQKKVKIILSNPNSEKGIMDLESMPLFNGWIDCLLESVCKDCWLGDPNCIHYYWVFNRKYSMFKNHEWTKATKKPDKEKIKLLKACLVEYSNNCSANSIKNIEFTGTHDGYRKTLSGDLKQSFRKVIYKMLKGRTLDSIIDEYKTNTSKAIGWFTPVILDDNDVLWEYVEYGYIREKRDGKMYLYYKQRSNDKDIDLLAFYDCLSSNYINFGEIKSVEKKNDKWHIVVENNGVHSYEMEKNYTSVTGVIS